MPKTINLKKKITPYAAQLIAALFIIYLLSKNFSFYTDKQMFTQLFFHIVILGVLLLTSKFPHELCHKAVAEKLGFKCKVEFGVFVSESKIRGIQTYKQVIMISIAPLLYFLPMSAILFISSIFISSIINKQILLSILIYWLASMVGDFMYIYYALTNREAKFVDNGSVLLITSKE